MTSVPFNGVCVVGRYVGTEPVRHRADHPTKAGKPVPGMFRLSVAVSDLEGDWPVSCGYFLTDRITHEPTRAGADVARLDLSAGDRIACRVAARSNGSYVNYDLLEVARLGASSEQEGQ
jgi:hypothetical protein